MQLSQYQHESTPVPSIGNVCPALWCRNIRPSWPPTWRHWRLFTWGVSNRYLIYTTGLMSLMQRCFSDLVCQPLVTSCIIDAYLWPCWTPRSWSARRQKANDQLEKTIGPPSERPQQGPGGWQRPTTFASTLWRSEIARGHGAVQRFTRTTRRRWWLMTGHCDYLSTHLSLHAWITVMDCWLTAACLLPMVPANPELCCMSGQLQTGF